MTEMEQARNDEEWPPSIVSVAHLERYDAYPDAHSRSIVLAVRKVLEHPYHVLRNQSHDIRTSLEEVVMPNHAELVRLLEQPYSDKALASDYHQNAGPAPLATAHRAAVHRAVHNYVSSVFSLRKHVEAILDHRKKSLPDDETDPLRVAWDTKKAALASSPENLFIFDLRHYIQHYAVAPLDHETKFGIVDGHTVVTSSETLVVAALLRRLHDPSTDAMLASGTDVELKPIILAHGPMVCELNTWFADALISEGAPLLDEYNEVRAECEVVIAGTN